MYVCMYVCTHGVVYVYVYVYVYAYAYAYVYVYVYVYVYACVCTHIHTHVLGGIHIWGILGYMGFSRITYWKLNPKP